MDLLPTTAAPGVAERAEALADAACELHDAVSTPASWSAAAVEDAVESMETTALALAAAHPDAAAAMLAIGQQLAQLRERLDLPPGEHAAAGPDDDEHQEQPVEPPTPIRRPRRRGLGPGYQGLRIPPGRTATGR
ncbi:hypothetical protein OG416_39140 (plasmid) [Streptomyces longwoodensis]|uniref:hypothetical protein n=1 Tax=Streptomyces longwoodensis TaxID=68231 RepID=UPI00352FC9F0|nr:hypothetical protein OG416_39140 [Streptomyces longwoodensis]